MVERGMNWLGRLIGRYWLTVLIFVTLVSVIVYSLDDANWIDNDAPLVTSLMMGIGFGWLLAKARFRWPYIVLYALFISVVIPIQAVSNVLPSLGDMLRLPTADLINQMNLRGIEFSLRAAGWIETLRTGENIQDTGLFVLLLGMILALCAIWLMWSLIRQRRVLNGLLPVALLMAINVHLSRQPLTNYMFFLFSGMLLIARTSFNQRHEDWKRRRVDFPDQLGIEWGASVLALAMAVVVLARLAPLFGTPEGWRAVSEWINRYHEETSDTATRLFSGVNPPPPPPEEEQEVRVNTPNMAQIGDPISQGPETIMWVRISDPPPAPSDIAATIPEAEIRIHYWRNGIYGAYTGRGWQQALLLDRVPSPEDLPGEPSPGRYYLRQDFDVVARNNGTLFSVNNPVQTDPGVYLLKTKSGDSQNLDGQEYKYQVISEATNVSANELAGDSVDYPPEIRETFLNLPDTLPERVRTLSRRIAEGQDDPYHKAMAVQNYLRENFKYDLSTKETPANRDVVDHFLFDSKQGFCSHYASAMVVMLRVVDVPARVVSGYAMGEYNMQEGAYRVPESAAHAWVEVYFPSYGWVEFEPTAGRLPIVYREDTPLNAEALPSIAPIDQKKADPSQYLIGAVLVGALALLALPFFLLRMFSTARHAPVIAVETLYRRMRRLLAWAGLRADPSMTPDEYLSFYSGHLQPYQRLSQALQQVTSLYRETTYSAHTPDEGRVRRANSAWQQSFSEWLTLWLKASWRQLRARITE